MKKPIIEQTSWCLNHQLPETQASPLGRVCPKCKQRLYTSNLGAPRQRYWESQPVAYRLHGTPCFVYNLVWDNFHIRSLQIIEEPRPSTPAPLLLDELTKLTQDDVDHITQMLQERGLIADITPEQEEDSLGFDPPSLDFDFDLPDFDAPE